MKPSAQLLRIMYAPRDYAHADHWPASLGASMWAVPACVANRQLIDAYGLDTRLDFAMPADPLLTQCIVHWARLPRICQLIGLQCRRSLFLRASTYARLDPVSRRFLRVPLLIERPHTRLQTAAGPNESLRTADSPETTALAAGLMHIERCLRPLPNALRQRLMLLFPRGLSQDLGAPALLPATTRCSMTLNLNLFHQAVHHALLEPASVS